MMQGLTEVLVALFLIMTLLLTLSKQMVRLRQVVNQLECRVVARHYLDNASERLYAKMPLATLPASFQLSYSHEKEARLELRWIPIVAMGTSSSHLQRQVCIL